MIVVTGEDTSRVEDENAKGLVRHSTTLTMRSLPCSVPGRGMDTQPPDCELVQTALEFARVVLDRCSVIETSPAINCKHIRAQCCAAQQQGREIMDGDEGRLDATYLLQVAIGMLQGEE